MPQDDLGEIMKHPNAAEDVGTSRGLTGDAKRGIIPTMIKLIVQTKMTDNMKTRDKVYVLIADDDNVGTAREEPTKACNTEYLRKGFVEDFIRDQLKVWVDTYRLERIIDKLEEI